MEYSKEINSLLGSPNSSPISAFEDSRAVLKVSLSSVSRKLNLQLHFSLKLLCLISIYLNIRMSRSQRL